MPRTMICVLLCLLSACGPKRITEAEIKAHDDRADAFWAERKSELDAQARESDAQWNEMQARENGGISLKEVAERGYPAKFPTVEMRALVGPIFDAIKAINADPLCWGRIYKRGETTTLEGNAMTLVVSNQRPHESLGRWYRGHSVESHHMLVFTNEGVVVSYSSY